MTINRFGKTLLTTLLLSVAASAPADAHERAEKQHHRPEVSRSWSNRHDGDHQYRIWLSGYQESRIQRELRASYFNKCRNRHGCTSSSNWGRRYQIGYPLPPHAVVWRMPNTVHRYLPPPAYGTRYVWVDRELLLISDRTGTILDIVLQF